MENTEPVLKGGEIASCPKRAKSIHKKWVDLRTGAKALFTDLGIVLQLSVLAFLYAFFAFKFKIFYYVSLALTLLTGVYVFICERDVQSKTSWLFLLLVSFGSGYIVYFLADKRVCYGYDKMRYDKIAARTEKYTKTRCLDGRSEAVKNDCEYVRNSGGYVPYANTAIKYYRYGERAGIHISGIFYSGRREAPRKAFGNSGKESRGRRRSQVFVRRRGLPGGI